jgi:hypothetical protein
MLHRCFVFDTKLSDCLCKCYIVVLYLIRSSQIVCINVTSLCLDEHCEVLRFFVYMLHPCFGFALWNSQIVYVNVTALFWIWYEIFRLFMQMLHRCFRFAHWSSQTVYVNVTSLFWIYTTKLSDCLCECYIVVLNLIRSYQIVYECYIVVLYLIRSSWIVYVNVTSLFCIWYEVIRLFM